MWKWRGRVSENWDLHTGREREERREKSSTSQQSGPVMSLLGLEDFLLHKEQL